MATAIELAEWTGVHDTTGVLLPGLLERATFRIVAHVFDLDQEGGDWDEVVQVVKACFPGRPIVGYEWGRPLTHALAAGFTTVAEHRVWFR